MLFAITFANSLASSNQTVVETNVEPTTPNNYVYEKTNEDQSRPGDAAMLYHIPGLTLTESGGPLSPTTIRYRGLSGLRFPINLEGLRMNNPANGILDANSMFLFAAKNLETHNQSLSITLPHITKPQAKGIFGYGSQNSVKVGAMAGAPLGENASVFLASQLSSTNGEFSFARVNRVPKASVTTHKRQNNDQTRLQTVGKYQRVTPNHKHHVLIAANAHEGGVPGFAFAPTPHLRNEALYLGVDAGAKQTIKTAEFSVDIANSVFDYRTDDQSKNKERILSSAHDVTLGIKPLDFPPWIDMEFGQKIIVEKAYGLDKTRLGSGFIMKRDSRLKGRLKPKIFSYFSMLGYEQAGLIFQKDLGASIELNPNVKMLARFARTQRLPTFIELYANNAFFAGNENLQKEGVWDIELASQMLLGQSTSVNISAYLGYLSDVIIYAPYFAGRLRPVNSGAAKRHGVDLAINYEPSDMWAIESKNGFLHTKVRATDSPMPQAPPFMGLLKVRVGRLDFLNASIQTRYRGAAAANLYGTLKTDPYAIVDIHTAWQISEQVGISLLASNLLNNKKARDTYEMPTAGTMFYGQIEIGSMQ